MANIRKTFNFRNGVQVDEDNLVVNPLGLVGIGTSVPTEILDVRGTAKVVGLVTASQIFTNSLTVGLTTNGNLGVATISSANIGIASVSTSFTAGNLSITSGIVTALSGFVTFYGDGSGLYNIPTSQWVDIDVGLGFTSIYAAGYVGVATVDPRFAFQVGGNNIVGSFQNGVGINSTGDILATGIISATTLRGNGALISGLNASNISSGTLNNSRLPANLNISGVSTFLQSLYINQNLNVPIIDGPVTVSGSSTITGSLTVGGATTIGGFLSVSGISSLNSVTVGVLTATTSTLGISTATTLQVQNIRLGVAGSGEIDTSSGNLTLNSSSGNTIIDDNLLVFGISTLSGEVTVDTGLIPHAPVDAYLGKSGREFSEAWIDTITIGVDAGKITTSSGNLILDSAGGEVTALQNLYATGQLTSNGTLNIGSNVLPTVDLNSNLGSVTNRFNQAHLSYIQIGVGSSNKINSTNSTDLLLDSATGTTFIDDNLKVSGIGTFTGELIANTGIVPGNNNVYLGSPSQKFSEAYIDNITIGVGNSTTINTTSGNLTLNASSGITTVTNELNVGGVFKALQSTILNSLTVNDTSVFNSNVSISTNLNATNVNVSGQLFNFGGISVGTTTPYGPFQIGEENQFISTVVATASTIAANTTTIIGIDTSGITVGLKVLELDNLIASGTTVISIGSSQVGIGKTTLNDSEVNDVDLTFGTGYVNDRVFVIDSTKSVGIGTTNPTAKLDVRGDARIGINTSAGAILTSANGTKYRLIVSNAGVLSTVLVP